MTKGREQDYPYAKQGLEGGRAVRESQMKPSVPGADDDITQPFSASNLVERMKRFLNVGAT